MTNMIDNVLAIAISGLILFQAYMVRRAVGTWLFPAVIFGVFWFLVTFAANIIGFGAPVSPLAMLYILAGSVAFSLGSIRAGWRNAFAVAHRRAASGADDLDTPFMFLCLVAFSAAGSLMHLVDMLIQGFTLNDLLYNVTEAAGSYTERRYNQTLVANIFAQGGLILGYLSAMIGGLLVGKGGRGRLWAILALSFTPSFFLMLAQSAKGALFLALFFFAGGIFVRAAIGRYVIRIQRRTVFIAAVASIVLVFFVGLSFVARLGDQASGELLTRYFVSYTASHIFAFSDWFSWYTGKPSAQLYYTVDTSYGFYTFIPVFRMMGDDRFVPLGLYDEYYQYSNIMIGNIYTIYRGLITDFGIVGGLVAVMVCSIVCHQVFRVMLRQARPGFAFCLIIFLIGAIYHSYLGSIMIYASMYVLPLLLWGVLKINAVRMMTAGDTSMVARGRAQ